MIDPVEQEISSAIEQLMDKLGPIIVHKTISPGRTFLLKASFQMWEAPTSPQSAVKVNSEEEQGGEVEDPQPWWVIRLYERHEEKGLSVREARAALSDLFERADLEGIVAASMIQYSDPTILRPRVQLTHSWDTQPTGMEVEYRGSVLDICIHEDVKGIMGFDPIHYDNGEQLAWEFLDISLELLAELMKEQQKREEQETLRTGKISPVRPKSKFAVLDDKLCQAEHKLELAHRRLKAKLKRDAKVAKDLKTLLQQPVQPTSVEAAHPIEPAKSGAANLAVDSEVAGAEAIEVAAITQVSPAEA